MEPKHLIIFTCNWHAYQDMEMAGASISLHHLDGELIEMLDHPCDCAQFRAG